MLAAMAVAALFISQSSARRLSEPIVKLAQASTQLAEDQLHEDIELQGDSELAYLTASFNSMRRKVEKNVQAAKDSESRMRVVFESAANGMVLVDAAGHIIMANSHLESLFGYAKDCLIGRSVDVLVPERVRAEHPALRTAYFANPEAKEDGDGARPDGNSQRRSRNRRRGWPDASAD